MTWRPSQGQLDAAFAHAAAEAPAEACGVFAGGCYRPVTNRATVLDRFVMDMREYVAIAKSSPIEAVVHAHPRGVAVASQADRSMCEATARPWLITVAGTREWAVIEPCGFVAPLVGRQWQWQAQDCLSLVRDGLKAYAGLDMPAMPYDWRFWETDDLISARFAAFGFVAVKGDDWQHLDVAAMRTDGAAVINHLGLYLEPDTLLHQLAGRYSKRDTFGGRWRVATVLHLRHRQLDGGRSCATS